MGAHGSSCTFDNPSTSSSHTASLDGHAMPSRRIGHLNFSVVSALQLERRREKQNIQLGLARICEMLSFAADALV
jgi:hypothetical protein